MDLFLSVGLRMETLIFGHHPVPDPKQQSISMSRLQAFCQGGKRAKKLVHSDSHIEVVDSCLDLLNFQGLKRAENGDFGKIVKNCGPFAAEAADGRNEVEA